MTQTAVALIPARSGSKGVPDKNIRPLAGHPLLGWSIRAALLTSGIDRVIVSTDSERYAEIARSYGAEAPFLRPVEISGDRASDLSVVRHLLDWLAAEDTVPDLVVHLRPTTPLRRPATVAAAIAALQVDRSATALRSVHEMSETAYKTLEMQEGFLATAFERDLNIERANQPRQNFPVTWTANGYVDILRSATILDRDLIHGDRVIGFETPRAHEVDSLEDFELLEFVVGRSPDLVEVLFGHGGH